MNQRMIELYKQAQEFAYKNISKESWNTDNFHAVVSGKFAELMAWEAIGVCRVDVDALTGPFLPEYEKGIVEGYRRANENLRVYFGVEE